MELWEYLKTNPHIAVVGIGTIVAALSFRLSRRPGQLSSLDQALKRAYVQESGSDLPTQVIDLRLARTLLEIDVLNAEGSFSRRVSFAITEYLWQWWGDSPEDVQVRVGEQMEQVMLAAAWESRFTGEVPSLKEARESLNEVDPVEVCRQAVIYLDRMIQEASSGNLCAA